MQRSFIYVILKFHILLFLIKWSKKLYFIVLIFVNEIS